MNESDPEILRVAYMELCEAPAPTGLRVGPERITRERLNRATYLDLYKRVGEPLRWDQRLQIPDADLVALLEGGSLNIYVMRNEQNQALGFCEFDRHGFPEVELKNFGLVPESQGRGLGPWLLSAALREEWNFGPTRIWLHTDTWDHPAAIRLYERAGFRVYAVRDEAAGPL
jgi:ribosomal protein S18 acetylase RimI-like enzyme